MLRDRESMTEKAVAGVRLTRVAVFGTMTVERPVWPTGGSRGGEYGKPVARIVHQVQPAAMCLKELLATGWTRHSRTGSMPLGPSGARSRTGI